MDGLILLIIVIYIYIYGQPEGSPGHSHSIYIIVLNSGFREPRGLALVSLVPAYGLFSILLHTHPLPHRSPPGGMAEWPKRRIVNPLPSGL